MSGKFLGLILIGSLIMPSFIFAQAPPEGGGSPPVGGGGGTGGGGGGGGSGTQFTLKVLKDGVGSGTVKSADSPPSIDCGSVCEKSFNSGTNLTLRAIADNNSVFDGWTNCSQTDLLGNCLVTINNDTTVTATFNLKKTLTVSKSGTGAGTITSLPPGINCGGICSYGFAHGDNITLTAVANSGSSFGGWNGDCAGAGSKADCSLTMNVDKNAGATFDLSSSGGGIGGAGAGGSSRETALGGAGVTYALKINVGGSGRVTSNPPLIDVGADSTQTSTFPADEKVTLTAEPVEGAYLQSWSGDCKGSQLTCDIVMKGNRSVTVNFGVGTGEAGEGGYLDYFYDFFDFDFFRQYVKKIKKKKPYYLSVFDERLKGKFPFIGKSSSGWKITRDGKLRGSLGKAIRAYVSVDPLLGNTQVNFVGGKKGFNGQVSYYNSGNSFVDEITDLSKKILYRNESSLNETQQVNATLLFNGLDTLFGEIAVFGANSDQIESFFVTSLDPARGVSIAPISSKMETKLPSNLNLAPPEKILEEFFKKLGELTGPVAGFFLKKAAAAQLSFYQIAKLRSKLFDLLAEGDEANQWLAQVSACNELLLSGEDYFGGCDMLQQFDSEQAMDFIKKQEDKIKSIIGRLGRFAVLARPPDWLINANENALKIAKSVGVSENLARLLTYIPGPFVLTVLSETGKATMAYCQGELLECKPGSGVLKDIAQFVGERSIAYSQVVKSYRNFSKETEIAIFGPLISQQEAVAKGSGSGY